jgi:hypothetical protein
MYTHIMHHMLIATFASPPATSVAPLVAPPPVHMITDANWS